MLTKEEEEEEEEIFVQPLVTSLQQV